MPPGAEHLSVLISGTDLKVIEVWKPKPAKTATIGDAFKRTITFSAPDMPGMVFPSIAFPEVEGIKLYQARATVNDKIDRGSLTGERIDFLTYLCEKEGEYTLPAIAISWWDLNNKKMQKIILPSVNFSVAPGKPSPEFTEGFQTSDSPLPLKLIAGLAVLVLLLAAISLRFKNVISEKFIARQARRQESESAYFKRIAESTSPAQTLNAMTAWLARANTRSETRTLHSFASECDDPELTAQIDALQLAVISKTQQWDSTILLKALQRTRQSTMHERGRVPALSSLNPE